jgi:carbamoyl-phosphate synthase large subunit
MAITVLLTCVGGELAPQMIKNLKSSKRHDIRVVGVDVNQQSVGKFFCDEFYTAPPGSDSSYVDRIVELILKHGIDLVIPTSDEESLALSNKSEYLIKSGAVLACVDIDTLSVLNDKAKTYSKLMDNGIHVPKWKKAVNFDELLTIARDMYKQYGDIVIKPTCERGGRGVHIVSNSINGIKKYSDRREIFSDFKTFQNKLIKTLDNYYPVMVMERLIEPVFDIDMLAWKGNSVTVVPRRRINSAIPNEGHIIVDNPELVDLGKKIIDIFQLSWLYDCDVMYDNNNRPCVLEVNPRQSGSISVSVESGIPIFDDLISLAIGETVVENQKIPSGCRVISYKSLKVIP